MNTNCLAKHYETLTPRERLPLIMAASARGDEAERQRLIRSAPQVGYRVPDHFGLAMAFREVCELHFMELLDLAGLYEQCLGLADVMESEKHHRKALDLALFVGYQFAVKLAGWRQFCAGLNLDPDLCWSCFPGYGRIKRAEAAAGHTAFTPEGVVAYLRREDRDAGLLTADDIATGLRECLEARAEWWG